MNFAIVVLLTHVLGATRFGAYASAVAWTTLLAVVAVLGLAPLVVRHVAGYSADEAWGRLRGLLAWAHRSVGAASAITVAVAAGVGVAIYHARPELLWPLLASLPLVPLIALTTLRQAAMQGLGRVVLGRIPDTLLTPVAFIVLIVASDAVAGTLTATAAVGLQAASTAIGFLVGALLLRRSMPGEVRQTPPETDRASWRRSAASLLALNVIGAAGGQVGTILLGAVGTARDAGVFNVAYRTTIFISFLMVAATYPLSPLVARLYARGEIDRLQATVVRVARTILLVSLPVAAILVALAPSILRLFGSGFDAGATAVRIIAVGDVVNVLTGFGGVVLVMCGREGDLARSVGIGTVLNVALTAALVPTLGVDGAAIGSAAGLVVSNVAMTWYAARRLGVYATVAGRVAATAER